MKVKDHHVFYSAAERSVTILFENEKKLATASVTMSINQALQLGRDLSQVLNPIHEDNPDSRSRPTDSPGE